tara:strand:+ start:146 stop:829 length:684 start_codon:yes stop_codon:yes gene_type:complete
MAQGCVAKEAHLCAAQVAPIKESERNSKEKLLTDSDESERKPRRKKTSKKKDTDPRVNDFKLWFSLRYKALLGRAYNPTKREWGRIQREIKSLLETHDIDSIKLASEFHLQNRGEEFIRNLEGGRKCIIVLANHFSRIFDAARQKVPKQITPAPDKNGIDWDRVKRDWIQLEWLSGDSVTEAAAREKCLPSTWDAFETLGGIVAIKEESEPSRFWDRLCREIAKREE